MSKKIKWPSLAKNYEVDCKIVTDRDDDGVRRDFIGLAPLTDVGAGLLEHDITSRWLNEHGFVQKKGWWIADDNTPGLHSDLTTLFDQYEEVEISESDLFVDITGDNLALLDVVASLRNELNSDLRSADADAAIQASQSLITQEEPAAFFDNDDVNFTAFDTNAIGTNISAALNLLHTALNINNAANDDFTASAQLKKLSDKLEARLDISAYQQISSIVDEASKVLSMRDAFDAAKGDVKAAYIDYRTSLGSFGITAPAEYVVTKDRTKFQDVCAQLSSEIKDSRQLLSMVLSDYSSSEQLALAHLSESDFSMLDEKLSIFSGLPSHVRFLAASVAVQQNLQNNDFSFTDLLKFDSLDLNNIGSGQKAALAAVGELFTGVAGEDLSWTPEDIVDLKELLSTQDNEFSLNEANILMGITAALDIVEPSTENELEEPSLEQAQNLEPEVVDLNQVVVNEAPDIDVDDAESSLVAAGPTNTVAQSISIPEMGELSHSIMQQVFDNAEPPADLLEKLSNLHNRVILGCLSDSLSREESNFLKVLVHDTGGTLQHLTVRSLILDGDNVASKELLDMRDAYRQLNDAVTGAPGEGVPEIRELSEAINRFVATQDDENEDVDVLSRYAHDLAVRYESLNQLSQGVAPEIALPDFENRFLDEPSDEIDNAEVLTNGEVDLGVVIEEDLLYSFALRLRDIAPHEPALDDGTVLTLNNNAEQLIMHAEDATIDLSGDIVRKSDGTAIGYVDTATGVTTLTDRNLIGRVLAASSTQDDVRFLSQDGNFSDSAITITESTPINDQDKGYIFESSSLMLEFITSVYDQRPEIISDQLITIEIDGSTYVVGAYDHKGDPDASGWMFINHLTTDFVSLDSDNLLDIYGGTPSLIGENVNSATGLWPTSMFAAKDTDDSKFMEHVIDLADNPQILPFTNNPQSAVEADDVGLEPVDLPDRLSLDAVQDETNLNFANTENGENEPELVNEPAGDPQTLNNTEREPIASGLNAEQIEQPTDNADTSDFVPGQVFDVLAHTNRFHDAVSARHAFNEAIPILDRLDAVVYSPDNPPPLSEKELVSLAKMPRSLNNMHLSLHQLDRNVLSGRGRDLLTGYYMSICGSKHLSRTFTMTNNQIEALSLTLQSAVSSMYTGEEKLRVLIPYAGTGDFVSQIPLDVRDKCEIIALEADELSCMLIKAFNPDVQVLNAPFTESNLDKGELFDIVVGNGSLNSRRRFEKNAPKVDHIGSLGHGQYSDEHMIAHSVELIKPGGTAITMVSSHVMNPNNELMLENEYPRSEGRSELFRETISGKASLLGVARLPANQTWDEHRTKRIEKIDPSDVLVFRRNDYTNNTRFRKLPWASAVPGEVREFSTSATSSVIPNDLPTSTRWVNEFFASDDFTGELYFNEGFNTGTFSAEDFANPYIEVFRNNIDSLFDFNPEVLPSIRTGAKFNFKKPLVLLKEVDFVDTNIYLGAPAFALDPLGAERVGVVTRIEDKDGGYVLEVTVDEATPAKVAERQADFVRLGGSVRAALKAQEASNGETEGVIQTRAALNDDYDRYVAKHGNLHDPISKTAIRIDPAAGQILAIEDYDDKSVPGTVTVSKNPIFYERVIDKHRDIEDVDTPLEALTLCMAKHGRIVPSYIESLLDAPWAEIENTLSDRIFVDPKLGRYVLSDFYLSGDIATKLEEARYAAEQHEGFQRNVDALVEVIPAPLDSSKLVFSFGAEYIPDDITKRFLDNYFLGDGVRKIMKWSILRDAKGDMVVQVKVPGGFEEVVAGKFPNEYIRLERFVSDTLNQKLTNAPVKASDNLSDDDVIERTEAIRASQALMRNTFQRWVNQSPTIVEMLTNAFNENHNRLVMPKYNGNHLSLRGIRKDFTPWETQSNGVWRGLIDGGVIYAHEAGVGKSKMAAMLAVALSQYRGERQLLVPKPNTLNKFVSEIYDIFPQARVFVIDSERNKPQNREETKHLVLNGNYDVIVAPHNVFERMGLSEKACNDVFTSKITKVRESFLNESRADSTNKRVTTAVTAITRDWQKQLKKINVANPPLLLDELGIDGVVLDENQDFKNYPYATKHQNVSGLHTSPSQKATFAWIVADHFHLRYGGDRGFSTMSGTPVPLSLIETYTLLNVVRPSLLKSTNIDTLDQYIKVFCELRGESTPDGRGGVKTVTKIKFHNGEPLMRMAAIAIDFATTDMAGIDRPNLITNLNVCDKTDAQRADDMELRLRIEKMEKEVVPRTVDNVLKQRAHMALAAVDTRLRFNGAPGDVKIMAVIRNVIDYYHKYADVKGTQAVYLDVGVPNSKAGKFNLYEDAIKRSLVEHGGIPEDEIVFSQDAKGDTSKLEDIHAQVRSGEKRVLIASTEQSGVGAEIQDRLIAIHLVTLDHRPDFFEQKLKRILRIKPSETKDLFKDVFAEIYVTENSEDAMKLDRLNDRIGPLRLFMSGSAAFDSLDEDGESSLAQLQESLWGDIPEVKLRNDLNLELVTARSLLNSQRDAASAAALRKDNFEKEKASITHSLGVVDKYSSIVNYYHERNLLDEHSLVMSESDNVGAKAEEDGLYTGLSRLAELTNSIDVAADGTWSLLGEDLGKGYISAARTLMDDDALTKELLKLVGEKTSTGPSKVNKAWFLRIANQLNDIVDSRDAENNDVKRPNKAERGLASNIYNDIKEAKLCDYADQVLETASQIYDGSKYNAKVSEIAEEAVTTIRKDVVCNLVLKKFVSNVNHYKVDNLARTPSVARELIASNVRRDSVAEFSYKGVPCLAQLGDNRTGYEFLIGLDSSADNDDPLVKVSATNTLARHLTPTGMKDLKSNLENALSVAEANLEQLDVTLTEDTELATKVEDLEKEVARLDSTIILKQAEVMSADANKAKSVEDYVRLVQMGDIEPDVVTLANVGERVRRFENIQSLSQEKSTKIKDAESTTSSQSEASADPAEPSSNSLEGELLPRDQDMAANGEVFPEM